MAASGVVLLVILVAVSTCRCCRCRSEPRPIVVGRWAELHNANSMALANTGVSVVHTSSTHLQCWMLERNCERNFQYCILYILQYCWVFNTRSTHFLNLWISHWLEL
jgi:hypothetical protein